MLRYWKEIGELEKWGMVGIFVIAFIAGSSIPTPISYLLIIFAMANQPTYGLWQPVLVGLSGGIGAGAGGTLVFLVGKGGRRLFPEFKDLSTDERAQNTITNKFMSKFNQLAHKQGSIVVFMMSALLNPAFAPMAIAMGATRFKAIKFFIMCTFGNLLKALVIAYIGFFGVSVLKGLFEKILGFLGVT